MTTFPLKSAAHRMSWPGLPATGNARNAMAGATRTPMNPQIPPPPVGIVGLPTTKLTQDRTTQGASFEIVLSSRYLRLMQDGDLNALRAIAGGIVRQVRAQSRGTLKTRDLRRMGNPYGRGVHNPRGARRSSLGNIGKVKGVRGSVPSWNVINAQSGDLAAAWDFDIEQRGDRLVIRVFNTTEQSWFVLAGTRRMKAHGPSNVIVQAKDRLNTEWRRQASKAYHREQAMRMGR